ncbi:sensor domain-containing diguanylate cyclase [Xanthobacter sp. DSM 24535]|uniref:sensor domain-containing diguanylate cyclase n=1 Tax=Roseixanthobacter psychrophilus TaxID=3119917 RepID=UPI0037266B90
MFARLRQRLHHFEDRMTVGQQMSTAMAVVGLITLSAVAFVAASLSQSGIITHVKEEMASSAKALAQRLDLEISERYSDVVQLARMRALAGAWEADPREAREIFEQLRATSPQFNWIGFVDPGGIVRAATGARLEGASVASHDWFRNGLGAPAIADVEAAGVLGAALGLKPLKDAIRFVTISVPVYSADNRLLGALAAHLGIDWGAIQRGTSVHGEAVHVWLLGDDGNLLAGGPVGTHPFPADVVTRMKTQGRGAFVDTSDGERMLTGYAVTGGGDYPAPGWIVAARQLAAVAFADAKQLGLTILGIGLLALPVSFLSAYWLSRRIAAPLSVLTGKASEIGRDPRATNFPHQRGSLEVMQLSAALRALLRRLGSVEQRFTLSEQQYQQDMAELRQLADTDPLTGLLNRRSFLTVADAALSGTRTSDGLGILMADIDHFKVVNDTYGHAAGDAVIRHVAESIGAALRQHDRVARFGGEEFVVLLLSVDRAGMVALAERMRSAIGSNCVSFEGQEIAVTVSFGAALAQPGDRDVDEVIERADLGLYEAKNSGRNRVAVADRKPGSRAA